MNESRPPRLILREPLRWLGLALLLFAGNTIITHVTADRANRPFLRAYHVTARVSPSYDNRSLSVPISYLNPRTTMRTRVVMRVVHYDERPKSGALVGVEVARNDPANVRLAGTSADRGAGRAEMAALAALLSIVPAVLRILTLRRTRRLIGSDAPSFSMQATLAARRGGRHPLLHLYALDAAPDARAVCVVPLASAYGLSVNGHAFGVEVKGIPRPYGSVVARLAHGEILWPTGRSLAVTGNRPLPPLSGQSPNVSMCCAADPDRAPCDLAPWWPELRTSVVAAGSLIGIAVVATFITLAHAAHANTIAVRSRPAIAVVRGQASQHVTVEFAWDNATQRSRAPIGRDHHYAANLSYPVLVDPLDPSTVRMATEPYDAVGPIVGPWLCGAAVSGLLLRRTIRRRSVTKRVSDEPQYAMVATAREQTLRFSIIELTQAGDPPSTFRGVVLMMRTRGSDGHAFPPRQADVIVRGGFGNGTPVIVWNGEGHVPVSRLFFGRPLSSHRRPTERRLLQQRRRLGGAR